VSQGNFKKKKNNVFSNYHRKVISDNEYATNEKILLLLRLSSHKWGDVVPIISVYEDYKNPDDHRGFFL